MKHARCAFTHSLLNMYKLNVIETHIVATCHREPQSERERGKYEFGYLNQVKFKNMNPLVKTLFLSHKRHTHAVHTRHLG